MRSEPQLPLQTASINGYAMTYTEYGQGTPLVLVHGSLCDCRYWKSQMGPLGRSFRVLAPSLRHYWPQQWDGVMFSMSQHVDDLLAFIDTVGEGSAHVVGHSRGARAALETALREPQRVRSLTLADPGLPLPDRGDDLRGGFRQRALALIEAGEVDAGLALFVDTVSGADTWRRMVPWFKDMVRDNASTLGGQATEHLPPVAREQVERLALPTLLIGGALSPAPYPAVLDMLAEWLPAAHKEVIAGSSHGMNLGNPRAFNAAIENFLA
ncbi:alpha/beta fold hydrolase [Bordetella sp. BOR01]|uniref:alpha/beta fold hydrolase n=1 Tax=Bordetella sp. BOR01 TaxID=2854779 RepID=UPI001C44B3F9|nr:alpha/beta hydrolase [Bordetella sp. BOR01]MBV7484257.1 alpha/beta hydrolase [Bordetella sp. BOR01]